MSTIKHMTLFEFEDSYGSEIACMKTLLKLQAGIEGKCFRPGCTANVYQHYKPIAGRKAFLCRKCLLHYYPMANTLFDHSHVELREWFRLMFKMLLCRNGVAALEIHRETGHAYKTVYSMMTWIRRLMGECMEFKYDYTYLEVDESYHYTGKKGYNRHHYFGRGRGSLRTTSIVGIIERAGRAMLYVVSDTKANTLLDLIEKKVNKNCVIFTDSYASYASLRDRGYVHATVNHEQGEYVNHETGASTNTAENIFSNGKRNQHGTYRKVSEDKLQYYLNEQAFRHSFRDYYDYGFEELLSHIPKLKLDSLNINKAA